MNKAINLKNTTWVQNGRVAAFASKSVGFGIKNDKGELLSSDGVKPSAYATKSAASEMAPYADGFKEHSWISPLST